MSIQKKKKKSVRTTILIVQPHKTQHSWEQKNGSVRPWNSSEWSLPEFVDKILYNWEVTSNFLWDFGNFVLPH